MLLTEKLSSDNPNSETENLKMYFKFLITMISIQKSTKAGAWKHFLKKLFEKS